MWVGVAEVGSDVGGLHLLNHSAEGVKEPYCFTAEYDRRSDEHYCSIFCLFESKGLRVPLLGRGKVVCVCVCVCLCVCV